ncbi:Os07g0684050 [Oryza sativa Japonica Group]|uniref:Os07g0684050 protein n=1 Tax=Oryza sativa subsp. japonica TaxID=39947 RepID=C7J4W1_ORYSJ|nr:Os07g0684050 [Oryza sativa Japonica Group]|eukprot:NP_001175338.1 Os07g0684050 [Oryza sativa Japonica Group]
MHSRQQMARLSPLRSAGRVLTRLLRRASRIQVRQARNFMPPALSRLINKNHEPAHQHVITSG